MARFIIKFGWTELTVKSVTQLIFFYSLSAPFDYTWSLKTAVNKHKAMARLHCFIPILVYYISINNILMIDLVTTKYSCV